MTLTGDMMYDNMFSCYRTNKKVASLSKPCAMKQQKPATSYVVRAQKYHSPIPAMRSCSVKLTNVNRGGV